MAGFNGRVMVGADEARYDDCRHKSKNRVFDLQHVGAGMVVESVMIGVGACIVFDLWQRAVMRLTGIPPSNWALAGRWLLRLLSGGGLIAAGLATMPERRRELAAGWALHYAVAISYALLYAMMIQGNMLSAGWRDGLIFGLASVVVPWFFFMPATGAGLMARLSPNPPLACALALKMHAIFGTSLGIGFALAG